MDKNSNLVDVIEDKPAAKFCTATDAAEKLGISLDEVIKLIEKGSLPATKKGNKYVLNEDDLKVFAEGSRKKTIKVLSIAIAVAVVIAIVMLVVVLL